MKYATAGTQILTTSGQIPKVTVSGVSGFVSGVFVGSPLVFEGICPRICALYTGSPHLRNSQFLKGKGSDLPLVS